MKKQNKYSLDAQKIFIKGARVHNLKNVDVELPKNKFIVVTGVSGSGKSSLTIDTLYAEGQRRYVESLSSYARQFLTRMDKPDVDYIKGLCPAIAIEQKVNTRNPRSTVATSTELYDYLKLLFSRIGRTISPISGNEVKKHSTDDVIDVIKTFSHEEPFLILASIKLEKKQVKEQLQSFIQQGFVRLMTDGKIDFISLNK